MVDKQNPAYNVEMIVVEFRTTPAMLQQIEFILGQYEVFGWESPDEFIREAIRAQFIKLSKDTMVKQ
jgi:hypothetical protein